MTVHDARPATCPGYTALGYDIADADDPALTTQLPARTVLPVRPAEGLSSDEQHPPTPAPAVIKLLDLPDCAYTGVDDAPCYPRPAFVVVPRCQELGTPVRAAATGLPGSTQARCAAGSRWCGRRFRTGAAVVGCGRSSAMA